MGESLTTAITTLFSMVGTVVTEITGQPLLAIMLVGGTVVPLAIRTFRKMRRA